MAGASRWALWVPLLLLALICAGAEPHRAPGREQGYLDVTTFEGVDASGRTDSTAGLRAAIVAARDRSLALWLPLGTYLISEPVVADQLPRRPGGQCAGHDYAVKNIVLVGEQRDGRRPVLRLADRAPAFADPAAPRALLHIRFLNGDDERTNCSFANGVRQLDFDLGRGNPGAIALRFGGAQECFLEDVRIEARDGYAGLLAWPGRGSAARNVTVIGGRFGIDADDGEGGALGGHLLHVTLRGQREAAIVQGSSRGVAVIGLEVEKDAPPAILTRATGEQGGHFALYDSVFRFGRGSGPVVAPLAGEPGNVTAITMRNVFVTGADVLVARPGGPEPVVLAPDTWTRIDTYAQVAAGLADQSAVWINGAARTADLLEIVRDSGPPPADYRAVHFWAGPPAPNDVMAVDAVAASAGRIVPDDDGDDAVALQEIIDRHDVVFLRRGIYRLDRPLRLRAHTVLFGVPGRKTVLAPRFNRADTWAVTTVDDADATTTLADIVFGNRPDEGWLTGALHWRAGRRSVVAHTRDLVDVDGSAARHELDPVQVFRISGSGGGRWFGWTDHAMVLHRGTRSHPDFRKLLVVGTREPLTFYGPNPEHGGQPERNEHVALVELADVENVRMFGLKIESNGELMRIVRSRNVFVGSLFGKPEGTAAELIRVEQTAPFEAQLLSWPHKGEVSGGLLVREAGYLPANAPPRPQFVPHLRRGGAVDWDAFSAGVATPQPSS